MATISWVGGSGAGFVNGSTTIATPSTPSGIADNDGLFAFVHTTTNTTVTPPAGWTQVTSAYASAVSGAYASKLFVFSKDAVASGDASTAYTFTAGASVQMSLHYAVVRASAGAVIVVDTATSTYSNVASGAVAPAPLTATRFGEMMLAAAGTTYAMSVSYSPSTPSGMTMWTGSQNLNLTAGAYQARNSGEAVSTGSFSWSVSPSDNGLVAVTLLVRATGVDAELADTVFVQDYSGQGNGFFDTLTETVGSLDAPGSAQVVPVADTFRSRDALNLVRVLARSADDTIGGADAPVYAYRPSGVVVETIATALTQAIGYTGSPTLSDTLSLADALAVAQPIAMAEGVGAAAALTAVQGVYVLQALGLAETLAPNAVYSRALTQALGLSDALSRFLSGALTETVGVTPAAAAVKVVSPELDDAIEVAETITPAIVFRVVAAETLGLSDDDVLRWVFSPTVAEGVELSAAYIQPSGSVTTWAINTRTAAVTEYTGYEFNSFAKMGRRYIAASSSGLYMLDGDTDDGASIVADLKTGFAQFAGSRFAGLKAVYLGMHGEGEFVLRVIEGDGTERDYRAVVADRRTAKVQVGKGLRARYFAFELISTGQVFDLDTIEMIPLLMQRRV